jgi:hypothetical protein
MTALDLLTELQGRGVELVAAGDKLRYRPRSAVEPDLLPVMREHKADILRMLAQRPAAPPQQAFEFTDGPMDFGDICAGWTPAGWAAELRRKADRCNGYRPDVGDYYRRWAAHIETIITTRGAVRL